MTVLPLPKEVYDAIKTGFALPEMEVYKVDGTEKSMKEYLKNPIVAAHPQAFLDGVELRKRVCFIFSADSMTDYNNDIASYDAKAKQLNQKYGDIFLTSAQVNESPDRAYGLVGYRVVPFAQITATEFPSGKITVKTPRANVEAADEATRSQLEFTEES
jgi:hypothetical protein